MIKPFPTLDAAERAHSGVIAEDAHGGWWRLGYRSTPTGPEVWSVGVDARGHSVGQDRWPETLKHKHYIAGCVGGGDAIFSETTP